MMWIAIFTFFLFIGYFAYGIALEKNWKIDIFRDSSDWQEDESIITHFGFRYVQLAQVAVFLSFEALLSAVYGYVYGLAYVSWLIIGTTFFGGALSYYGGMYALRHRGYTLNYAIKQRFGTFAHFVTTTLLLALIAFLVSRSYSSFSTVYENIFGLPKNLLLVYCAAVALFFCFCTAHQAAIIFSGLGIFTIVALGGLFFGSKLQWAYAEYGAHNFVPSELKYAFPFAFFAMVLGSINCLQGLQASLLAPMIKNEKAGRRIFFGASAFQAFILIIINFLVAAWNPNIQDFKISLFEKETPYIVLQNIAYAIGGRKVSLIIFALAFALFLGFIGSLARLARNLMMETKIRKLSFVPQIVAFVLVMASVFFSKHLNAGFECLAIACQITGIFCCLVLAKNLKDEGKKYFHMIWPAILLAGALTAYIMIAIFKYSLFTCYACGLAPLIVAITSRLLIKNRHSIHEKWLVYKQKRDALRKIRQEKHLELKAQKEQEKALLKEEREHRKKEKEELKKQEKAKKQAEAEKKKKASLSLMIAQDRTEGKNTRETSLEKQISDLQAERIKIDSRIKEIEEELEKEQSKRLLLETSESVVEKIQKDEEDSQLLDEIEKLDEALSDDEENIIDLPDLEQEISDDKKEKKPAKIFDFSDDSDDNSFEFETIKDNVSKQKTAAKIKQTETSDFESKQPASGKKKKNKKKKKSGGQPTQAN